MLTFCSSLVSFLAPVFQFVPYIFLCLVSKPKHQKINLDLEDGTGLTQLTEYACINLIQL